MSEWKKIQKLIEGTKDLDVDSAILIPQKQWHSGILTNAKVDILKALGMFEFRSVSELAKVLGRSRPNVAKDLRYLEHFGLVKTEKDGAKKVPSRVNAVIIIYP